MSHSTASFIQTAARAKKYETIFEAEWRRKLFQMKVFNVSAKFLDDDGSKNLLEMIDFIAAIDSIKKSSKSEPSSRFFGRLKFFGSFVRP